MRPKKKINQTDIARALGISNVSVSNALAGRKGVSTDLILKVRRTAAEMGYEMGKDEADGPPDRLLVVTPDRWSADRAERFTKTVQEQGFQPEYYTLDEALSGACAQAERCPGILIPEPLPSEELLALWEKAVGPVVGAGFFDRRVPMDYVTDDGFHGAQAVVQYLRGKGYERILYVKPDADGSASWAEAAMREDRLLGYRSERYLETLHRGQIAEQAQPFDTEEEHVLTLRELRRCIRARAADGKEPDGAEQDSAEQDSVKQDGEKPLRTAFFCGDMETAYALLDMLARKQIRVPEDAAVVGYRAGAEPCPQGRGPVTAYENDEKRLLEQCCAVLRNRRSRRETAEGVHLVSGEITEGGTA